MSLGHSRPRQLCPCSRLGRLTSLGMPPWRLGCLPWQEDRTQLNHPGTMAPECSAREGRKHPTSPCLVHFTAGFMQMTWKSAVSSAVAASRAWAHSHLLVSRQRLEPLLARPDPGAARRCPRSYRRPCHTGAAAAPAGSCCAAGVRRLRREARSRASSDRPRRSGGAGSSRLAAFHRPPPPRPGRDTAV